MIYVVKKGDSVYSISKKYGVSEARIRYDNQLNDRMVLTEGQSLLVLPVLRSHVIRQGDTLEGIALQYGITVRKLSRNNPFLIHQEYLFSGENVVIEYEEQENHPMNVIGYAYPFIEPYVIKEVLLYIEELLIFSYGFTTSGELVPPISDDKWLIQMAKMQEVRPILVLTPFGVDGQFNNNLVKLVVEDDDLQSALIQNLLLAMPQKGYLGVDVDFEYVLPEDREGYAMFVERLRREMNQQGYSVSVALAPKTSSEQKGLLYEGIDYKALGEAADTTFLMTYEWGYAYSQPMAVAPINKVRSVLDYAITEIPKEKIIMGIPNYGYDWTLPYVKGVTKAIVIGNVEAVNTAIANGAQIQFDEIAKSPYYNYWNNKAEHEVWFEDVRSMETKIRTAIEYGFHGFGYWNLMRLFRANWLLVNLLTKEGA